MDNIRMRDILLRYERKRDKSVDDLERKKEEVYTEIPQIKNIDNEITALGLSIGKFVILNPEKTKQAVAEIKDKIDVLIIKKQQLLFNSGYPVDYLTLVHECDKCKDKGYLPDGHRCSCLEQEIINEAYKMSNMDISLNKENFETFDAGIFSDQVDEEGISPRNNIMNIHAISMDFAQNFSSPNSRYKNLLFYGKTGLGKTFICNCIAKYLLDRGKLVLYQTSFNLFDIISKHKLRNSQDPMTAQLYRYIFSCDLLIIDDLGVESPNTFTISELFNILNTRLMQGKKTIISTNLSPIQLGKIYTERTFSRIFSEFKALKFIGRDIRIKY